jgi:hypothetical protein
MCGKQAIRLPPATRRGIAASATSPARGDGLHWILHGYETAWAEARGDLEKAVAVRLDTDGAGPLYDPPEEPPATMFGAAALLQALGAADVRRIAAFRGLTRGRSAFLAFPRHN